MRIVVWLMRLAIGGVFLFSGFAKAVDPFGSLYKFREYFTALGLWLPDSILLTGVILLCGLEFCLGLFLTLGCFRRGVPRVALALMCFMLVLTGWIAVANPISDCGCFGDAFTVSNSATFVKNIILTAGVVFLMKCNRYAQCLITPYLQWLALLAGSGFIVAVALYGYEVQPLMDFRPFPVGSEVSCSGPSEEDTDEEELNRILFIYERNGERKEVSAYDEQPDEADGWKFLDRREVAPPSATGSASELRLYTADDNETDVTSRFLEKGNTLLILLPEPERVSKSEAWKIEELTKQGAKAEIKVACILAGSDETLQIWKDILDQSVEVYKAEDTVMKMVARGNPAVVYVSNGKIIWKNAMRTLPVYDTGDWIQSYSPNQRKVLKLLSSLLTGTIGLLILLSFLPAGWHLAFKSRVRQKHKVVQNSDRKQ